MLNNQINLTVNCSSGTILSCRASCISVCTFEFGNLEILPNHEALIASLTPPFIIVYESNKKSKIEFSGSGFLRFFQNCNIFLENCNV